MAFGILGGLLASFYFFHLQYATQLWLFIPAIISLAYVVPFLSGKKRLRDIGLIKIFLIAISYAMISVLLVYMENDAPIGRQAILLFIEKALFIFAITIPFDMRDLEIDKLSKVRTLPMILGWKKSITLGKAILLICLVFVWLNGLYLPPSSAKAMMFAYVLSSIYFSRIDKSKTDLYYSFGMDGLMALQTLILFTISMV